MPIPRISKELISRASSLLLKLNWRVWYFGDNAGFMGLEAADYLLNTAEYSNYALGMLKGWNARRYPRVKYDQTLPGIEAIRLATKHADMDLLGSIEEHVNWIIGHRKFKGVYLTDDDYPDLIWVDTMSIHPPIIAGLGVYKQEFYDIASRLAMSYVELLQDKSGLFSHTYDIVEEASNNVHWGRGQGWALVGLLETIKLLPKKYTIRQTLVSNFEKCIIAVSSLQNKDGNWNTVIDEGSSPIEKSIAPFFVIVGAQAISLGLIKSDIKENISLAMNATLKSFSKDGLFNGVSEDTLSGNYSYYVSIKNNSFSPWSQGPPIAAIYWYNKVRDTLNMN